jgi:diguanylate cyclase (GGDEF)-like protein
MQVRLCDKYEFDKTARQRRLNVFGFAEQDKLVGQLLHETVIEPHKNQIVEHFYDFLLTQPETAVFISGSGKIARLKKTHRNYLGTLGIDYDQELYFENRLEVGLAHERIGLPLTLYLAAYRVLQYELINYIPDDILKEDKSRLREFILKITGLDMSLAMETYHSVQIEDLASSIIGLRHEQLELSTKVKYDDLTQALSRPYLMDALKRELELAGKRTIPTCIAMVDLDNFKEVNDTFGHLVGDQILQGVVGRIKSRMRNMDIVGRYGGEEFLLVFPATKITTTIEIVDRIRQHIADSPFHVEELSIPVTISGGVTASEKNDTIEMIIERADQLLYQAKNNGRNRVES